MLKFVRQLALQGPKVKVVECRHATTSSTSKVTEYEYDKNQERKPEQGLNKVQLMGRLGKDPQQFKGPNDSSFIGISLATTKTSRKSNSDNIMLTKTHWHDIIAGKSYMQDYVMTLGKGDRVLIEGELSYITNGNGTEMTRIHADNIQLISRKRKEPED